MKPVININVLFNLYVEDTSTLSTDLKVYAIILYVTERLEGVINSRGMLQWC